MDQHAVIAALRALALDLDHTPTCREFYASGAGLEFKTLKFFGSYSVLVGAAGLEQNRKSKPRKIDASIFNVDIERHLEQYQPSAYQPPGPYPSAAIVSDIHWPFVCQRVIDAFYRYVEAEKPEWVVLNGDAWDMYSHSKYPRSHNLFTPRDEERMAKEMNEKFWQEIHERAPEAKCVQMIGNHDIRPMKRVLESYPEAEDWFRERMKNLFSFEGVKTIFDPREEFYLDKRTIVFHGYRSKLGDHRDYTQMNCINGHTHVGGVVWKQMRSELIFEANSGIAGDPMAKGLTYTPQKLSHWTPGFLGMDRLGPRFIPA